MFFLARALCGSPGCSAVRGPPLCCGGRPQVLHSECLVGPLRTCLGTSALQLPWRGRCTLTNVLHPTACSASSGARPATLHCLLLALQGSQPQRQGLRPVAFSSLRSVPGIHWRAGCLQSCPLSPNYWSLTRPSTFRLLQLQGRPQFLFLGTPSVTGSPSCTLGSIWPGNNMPVSPLQTTPRSVSSSRPDLK